MDYVDKYLDKYELNMRIAANPKVVAAKAVYEAAIAAAIAEERTSKAIAKNIAKDAYIVANLTFHKEKRRHDKALRSMKDTKKIAKLVRDLFNPDTELAANESLKEIGVKSAREAEDSLKKFDSPGIKEVIREKAYAKYESAIAISKLVAKLVNIRSLEKSEADDLRASVEANAKAAHDAFTEARAKTDVAYKVAKSAQDAWKEADAAYEADKAAREAKSGTA
jgi:hypothetical protein